MGSENKKIVRISPEIAFQCKEKLFLVDESLISVPHLQKKLNNACCLFSSFLTIADFQFRANTNAGFGYKNHNWKFFR